MRRLIVYAALIITAVIFAAPTNAQFAQDNVKSDGFGNTGVGTDALFTMTPSEESSQECSSYPPLCLSNTAVGNNAMYSNTVGYYNTAIGGGALYTNQSTSENTAVGVNALYNVGNQSEGPSTAIGYEALADNAAGAFNTAVGTSALSASTGGYDNTAVGDNALALNQGSDNTALGAQALYGAGTGAAITGSSNTASGYQALYFDNTGSNNTASGAGALYNNLSGGNNTASGYQALSVNTTGSNNTASGSGALRLNEKGDNNTASGYEALYSNTTANNNTASGYEALYKNQTGLQNTAFGADALYANEVGSNTAVGYASLYKNTTGKYNTALGWEAGYNLTTGSNNIDISNPGASTDGTAADSGVIRIGTQTPTALQTNTYIAGIYGVKTASAGTAVFIDSSGQLGTVSSSIRYKEDVQPMAGASERLQQLRPVQFRYKKADASGAQPIQYGLIAEEVAKVYPELVVRDATTGRIDGVRYDELAPMLLNESQQQAAEIRDLKQQVAEMHASLLKLQAKDEQVAQR